MTSAQLIIVLFCGLIIGLAIYLLVRTLRKMAKGRCCEGCSGCSQAEHCSSLAASGSDQSLEKETD